MASKRVRRWRRRLGRQAVRRWGVVFGWVEQLWLLPASWLAALLKFGGRQFSRWQKSKNFCAFLLGMPSIVVLVLAGYIAIVAWKQPRSAITDRYDQQANRALEADDHRYARLCLERLIQLRGEDSQTLMRLAEVYSAQQDQRRVAALMTRLAPRDRTTIPEAHLWRARALLARGELAPDEVLEVEQQLRNALRLRQRDPLVRSLLAQVLEQLGRPEEALEMYRQIPNRSYGDSFRMADVASELGDVATATLAAEAALADYQARLQDQSDSWQAREDVVKCLVFLERFDEAVETLRRGRQMAEPDQLRTALARTYGTWVQVLQQRGGDVRRRIELIELTLRADPGSRAALNGIANLLAEADEDQQQRLRTLLHRMLVVGRATPVVHLCLGTDALLNDNLVDGIKHLQLAYQADPGLVAAANNLAWALAHADQPRLDEALAMVDTILLNQPAMAEVRDTRGQILVKQGRHHEAITDLESALKEMPQSKVTRQALVTAYREIGMGQLAAEHASVLARMAQD